MPLLGAHMSIAGGYYKAVLAAAELKMDCVQIFTKNNNQWRAKPLTDDDVARFQQALDETGIQMPCAHDSYLINLASPKTELWQKSLDAFVIELERAEALGLCGVVMHPGSFVDSTEAAGLKKIIKALNQVNKATRGFQVQTWLECTAGQGTNLGWRFEQLQKILADIKDQPRMGVCIDTCHLHAAGYRIVKKKDYEQTFAEFDDLIGLDRIKAFHLNDSKRELGSRVDRHEHIGEGDLGLNAFRNVLNDPHFQKLPMYMETPKGERKGKQLDAINLATLRKLSKQRAAR